jgi:hypothetical protein
MRGIDALANARETTVTAISGGDNRASAAQCAV